MNKSSKENEKEVLKLLPPSKDAKSLANKYLQSMLQVKRE